MRSSYVAGQYRAMAQDNLGRSWMITGQVAELPQVDGLVLAWRTGAAVTANDQRVPVRAEVVSMVLTVPDTVRGSLGAHGVALSDDIADVLGVDLGSRVALHTGDGDQTRVVEAIIDIPGGGAGDVAVWVDEPAARSHAEVALLDADPLTTPRLAHAVEHGPYMLRTLGGLWDDYRATVVNRSVTVALLDRVVVLVALVTPLLVLAAVGLNRSLLRRDLLGLTSAGMTRRRAMTVVGRAVSGTALIGCVVGTAAGAVIGRVWAALIGWLGLRHWWAGWSVTVLVLPTLTVVVVAAVTTWMTLGGGQARRIRPVRSRSGRTQVGAALVLVVVAVVLCVLSVASRLVPVRLVGVAVLAAGVISPAMLCATAATSSLPTVTRITVRTLLRPWLVMLMALGFVVGLGTAQVAGLEHAARVAQMEGRPDQPVGSLVARTVRASVASEATDLYRRAGMTGEHWWIDPVEVPGGRTLRVTSPDVLTCLEARPDWNREVDFEGCPIPDTVAPLNTVGLSSRGATSADPALVVNGKVALLLLDGEGKVLTHQLVVARADPVMGGLVPGVTLDPRGRAARDFHLEPSGQGTLLLSHFGMLSPRERATIRARIASGSPTAEVTEDDDLVVAQIQARAHTTAIVLALVGMSLAALLALAYGRFLGSWLLALRDLGATRRALSGLVVKVVGLSVVSLLASAGCGFAAAWFTGVHNGSGFGWWWVWCPVVVTLVTPLALVAAVRRVFGAAS